MWKLKDQWSDRTIDSDQIIHEKLMMCFTLGEEKQRKKKQIEHVWRPWRNEVTKSQNSGNDKIIYSTVLQLAISLLIAQKLHN